MTKRYVENQTGPAAIGLRPTATAPPSGYAATPAIGYFITNLMR
ncbi:hypothetical protein [Mycobacterium pseudokansasii]|uniref:Uncharacterized protein n=1 Tax=Mycobacterium pseudokansasii TaxID=2341080 RepID=A0A498QSR2_9MYCO|nr:hypothetical protein [Mycobacterium pseudokansasii]VAZ94006.1 hypothetical protein LAUMK35_02488 [Mycobacterium pseudokansasii]VAZ94990.1 hypothetical protein LAUMK21_02488 [Mycobacterium pseudokansasii]VBA50106.1 hypothetical protein LAUMK142_02379 [Mycobacterium pseudokansasii]